MPRDGTKPARRKARLAIEACILGADDLALGPEGLEDILLLQFLHDLGLQIWYFHKLRPSRAVYMHEMHVAHRRNMSSRVAGRTVVTAAAPSCTSCGHVTSPTWDSKMNQTMKERLPRINFPYFCLSFLRTWQAEPSLATRKLADTTDVLSRLSGSALKRKLQGRRL